MKKCISFRDSFLILCALVCGLFAHSNYAYADSNSKACIKWAKGGFPEVADDSSKRFMGKSMKTLRAAAAERKLINIATHHGLTGQIITQLQISKASSMVMKPKPN